MFKHSDIPQNMGAYDCIKANSDWDLQVAKYKPRFDPTLHLNIKFDYDSLRREIVQLYREYGWYKWRSQLNTNYSGISLHHNPDLPVTEKWCGSIGHPQYLAMTDEYYFERDITKSYGIPKNDYSDYLGFRKLNSEVAQFPAMSELFAKFKMPLVRARVATISGMIHKSGPKGGWHVDFTPMEMLRLLLVIESNNDYRFEYDYQGAKSQLVLEKGAAVVANTDIRHRPFIAHDSISTRTCLILNFTPWLDYDGKQDAWSFNEYYGKVHPYDIVREGLCLRS